MKYLLLIYTNPSRWEHPTFLYEPEGIPESRRERWKSQFEALLTEIADSGELIEAHALAEPRQTRTVTARNGAEVITDGPFIEAKEHLGGYFLIECDHPERAVEIAGRFPNAEYSAVEVRPVMTTSGLEM